MRGTTKTFSLEPNSDFQITALTYNDVDVYSQISNYEYSIPTVDTTGTLIVTFGNNIKTIHITTAGSLNTLLSSIDKSIITNLTVIGNIDARDIKCIRDEMTKLTDLDISETIIKAYSGADGTSSDENAMPQWSFSNNLTLNGKKTLNSIKLPNTITSIGDWAFNDCSGLTCNLEIPSNVKYIGWNAFSMCYNLSGSLYLPDSLITIRESAFYGCWGFSGNLSIPNAVTSIGNAAFNKCGFSGTLIISNSVNSIGSWAFGDSRAFNKIIVNRNLPPLIYSDTFEQIDKSICVLEVPKSASETYKTTNYWKDFINITESSYTDIICGIRVQKNLGGIVKGNNLYISNGTLLSIEKGVSIVFSIIADNGYKIESIFYNGIDIQSEIVNNQYTTPVVNANATLSVTFQKIHYRVSIKDAVAGTINLICDYGSTPSFDFTPTLGWKVNTVIYNNVDVTSSLINGVYTVPTITANSLLNVSFVSIATGAPELINNRIKVYSMNSEIIVDGTSEGETVTLYTINGKQIQTILSKGERLNLPVDRDTVYLVKTGEKTFKVIL